MGLKERRSEGPALCLLLSSFVQPQCLLPPALHRRWTRPGRQEAQASPTLQDAVGTQVHTQGV